MSIEPSQHTIKILNNPDLPIASRLFKASLYADNEENRSSNQTSAIASDASRLVEKVYGNDEIKGRLTGTFIESARTSLNTSKNDFADPDLLHDAIDMIEGHIEAQSVEHA